MNKISGKGFLILVVFIAIVCGIGTAWDFIKNILNGLWTVFTVMIPSFLVAFAPVIGLDEFIISKIIYAVVILLISSFLGIYITRKTEKNISFIISEIVGLVFTIMIFV